MTARDTTGCTTAFKSQPKGRIFIGTGIGGGLIIDGRMHHGFTGCAGEIGHMVIDVNGPKCGCGNRGCFEAFASRTALFNRIRLAVKEGQTVQKGDLLLKIKPDFYTAALNQAKASYQSSLASKSTATANLEKADAEFRRNEELFKRDLLSESEFTTFKTSRDVARAQLESAGHQVEVAKAAVDSAQDSLAKTTIFAPIDGTYQPRSAKPATVGASGQCGVSGRT